MNRRGFTLAEVMVALVVTSLVVALAWAALQGGLDTTGRLGHHREREDAFVTARGLIAGALRHALPGALGGPPTFAVVRRPGGSGMSDSLTFLTRGLQQPLGTSAAWRASLWVRGDTLRLEAVPLDGGAPTVTAAVPGVVGLRVRTLARATFASWEDQWEDASVAPGAVRVDYGLATGPGVTQVQRLGLEGRP